MKKYLGLALTLAVVVAAVGAPWLAATDPMTTDFAGSLKPPGLAGPPARQPTSSAAICSQRVLYGARLALFIGVCTVRGDGDRGRPCSASSPASSSAGRPRPSCGLADVQLSFPFILLALTINAIVGPRPAQHHPEPVRRRAGSSTRRVVRGEGAVGEAGATTCTRRRRSGVGRPRLLFPPRAAQRRAVHHRGWPACSSRSSSWPRPPSRSWASAVQPPTPAWGSMLSESRDFLYVAVVGWGRFPERRWRSRRSA